jgi:ABC-type polysaccharide/polyol phosphate export permease
MTIFAIPVSFLGTISFEGIIYIFLAFLLLLTFTIGASLLTSALNVRYRDINFFVQALIMIWFYATPIIYTLSMIPYKFYWLWRLNPMTSILQLLQHGFLNQPLPGIGMFTINLVIIAAVFTLGIIIFNKEGNNFDDWI